MQSDNAKILSAAEKQYTKMTQTPIKKLVASLAVPTVISMLITTIYNATDTYFVSKINISASGATGVVFSLMAILQAFGFMFGHGSGSCAESCGNCPSFDCHLCFLLQKHDSREPSPF